MARGDAEYTYRIPPDVAVRPAAAHLRSALLCFSSQLFESTEQVHASLYIEYRAFAPLFTGGITPLVGTQCVFNLPCVISRNCREYVRPRNVGDSYYRGESPSALDTKLGISRI